MPSLTKGKRVEVQKESLSGEEKTRLRHERELDQGQEVTERGKMTITDQYNGILLIKRHLNGYISEKVMYKKPGQITVHRT